MKLKEFYQRYARLGLRISEQDAYELQRVLHSVDGFESGRPGPGGGAEATPFSVAVFLIAVMAGGSRRRANETVSDYYEMLQEGAETVGFGENFEPAFPECPLTNERAFGPAFKRILADPKIAGAVWDITVRRDWPEATVRYRDINGSEINEPKESKFVDAIEERRAAGRALPGALCQYCTLGRPLLVQMANSLAENSTGVK